MWRRIADFLGVLGTDPASATVVVDLVPAVFFCNDFDDGVLFESTDFIVKYGFIDSLGDWKMNCTERLKALFSSPCRREMSLP